MISKNQVKYLNSLHHNKYRKIYREFVAEGSKLVLDILDSAMVVKKIYSTATWISENAQRLSGVDVQDVVSDDLKKISALSTANEVFAVVSIPEQKILNKELNDSLYLMLDGIRDPGNLGTIIRTADWFGIHNIVCSKDCVDNFNPKVVQASMGSIARVSVFYEELEELLGNLPRATTVYGTFMDGEDVSGKAMVDEGIIIIGSEARGISKELIPYITKKISIPSYGDTKTESLNAAVACAIVCYAFRRN